MPDDISVIYWNSKDIRPEEGSYILLKSLDENGQVICEPAAYENEMFIFIYSEDDWGEVNPDIILGWAYYPYDERGAMQENDQEEQKRRSKDRRFCAIAPIQGEIIFP